MQRGWPYQCGIDVLAQHDACLRGRRVGLITNPSAVADDFTPTADVMAANYTLAALFGPEHGVRGDAQAGATVGDAHNSRYGVPEYSLYGATRRLQPQWLEEIDVVVFDIQDIGSRYYTYIYTMGLALVDCAAAGIPFVVLDRPNPLGGRSVEGTVLRRTFRSFVGDYGLPVRHGLSVGELAHLIRRREAPHCALTVVPMPYWDRAPLAAAAAWINPSPNMPSVMTALVYNGTCLLEASNISEGRGTTRPYEVIGAPFVDHERLAAIMNSCDLPGVWFRPCCFTPTFDKHKGELCRGVQLHVTDSSVFDGFATGVTLFDVLRQETAQMEVTLPDHLNKLFGDDTLLNGSEPLPALLQRARAESDAFAREMGADLLYVSPV